MDNNEETKELISDEFDKNDYKVLFQKLKSISLRIDLLEQNFLNKKI